MSDTATDPSGLRQNLAASLSLNDPSWINAFASVPRHLFVPWFHRYTHDGGRAYDSRIPAQRDEWIKEVYVDDSLVTKFSDEGIALSSSTAPSLMGLMLDALDVVDGHRVLEVGTGTGYNTALLCHRLGDHNVVSVDIDGELVDTARDILAQAGYLPKLVTADGLAGYVDAAPYDRIIATCSSRRVPEAWIRQTQPGGIILANIGAGVAQLRVNVDGSAKGRFIDVAGFIEARPADGPRTPNMQQGLDIINHGAPAATEHDYDLPGDIDDERMWFLARILMPGLAKFSLHYDPERDHVRRCIVDADTHSWGTVDTVAGNGTVTQGGNRLLWDELMAIYESWVTADRPDHRDLGLTVASDGSHTIWRQGTYGVKWQIP